MSSAEKAVLEAISSNNAVRVERLLRQSSHPSTESIVSLVENGDLGLARVVFEMPTPRRWPWCGFWCYCD